MAWGETLAPSVAATAADLPTRRRDYRASRRPGFGRTRLRQLTLATDEAGLPGGIVGVVGQDGLHGVGQVWYGKTHRKLLGRGMGSTIPYYRRSFRIDKPLS